MDLVSYVLIFLFLLIILATNFKEVQKCSANKLDSIKFILWFPVLILLIFVFAVTMPLAKFIQTIISGVLKINFGNEYNGMLKGTDLVMGCNSREDSFIKILMVIKHNKTIATKSVFEYIKEMFERNRSLNNIHHKFFSTLEQSFGYLFFRKIKIEISDIVQKMPLNKSNVDELELKRFLKKCLSKPLPLDGKALWDVHVGTQPLKWKKNSDPNVEYFPLLIRTHHGIADGTSLVKHFQLFSDDVIMQNTSKPDIFYTLRPKHLSHLQIIKKTIWENVCGISLSPSSLYTTLFLRGHDKNDLHGKPFIKDTLFHIFADEDGIYFNKVKNIKRMHGNASFSDILVAAYSASLNEYYQKYSTTCPESITIGVPIVKTYDQLSGIASGRINIKSINVENNFVTLQMYLPMNISKDQDFNPESNAISRLNIIRKVANNLRSTTQPQFNYFLIDKFLGCLPASVLQTFLTNINSTTVGSFLPGPSKISFGNDALTISDCFFWVPHMIQVGISFTTLTFNDRLQMGISCNGQIEDQSRVDEILQNVCEHIDLIEQEFQSVLKNK